jgi:hypothetical protein
VRAFFEARVEHLTVHDRVRVECLSKMLVLRHRRKIHTHYRPARPSGWDGGHNKLGGVYHLIESEH